MAHVHPVPERPDDHATGVHPRPAREGRCTGGLRISAVLALVLALPGAAAAQLSPFQVEVRGGVTLPSDDFRDGGTGWDGTEGEAPSFGAGFTLVWSGRWGWTLGFGQDRFRCPAERCGGEDELVSTGFDLGLRVLLRSGGRVVPWIGGGALSYRVERHREGGESSLTDRGWGWQAGVGTYLVLTERIYLNPSARFRSLDLDRNGTGELRVRAVVLDVGLVLAF